MVTGHFNKPNGFSFVGKWIRVKGACLFLVEPSSGAFHLDSNKRNYRQGGSIIRGEEGVIICSWRSQRAPWAQVSVCVWGWGHFTGMMNGRKRNQRIDKGLLICSLI